MSEDTPKYVAIPIHGPDPVAGEQYFDMRTLMGLGNGTFQGNLVDQSGNPVMVPPETYQRMVNLITAALEAADHDGQAQMDALRKAAAAYMTEPSSKPATEPILPGRTVDAAG